jgi:Zn-dependent protease with chaperone function
MTAWYLRLLLWCYFPFLLVLCLVMAALVLLLVSAFWQFMCPLVILVPLLGVLAGSLFQVLLSLQGLWTPLPDPTDLEVRVPREYLEPVLTWMAAIARAQSLWEPHEIRFGAATVAHVYEDKRGGRILVLGGLAVAALSQEALAGVVAHELAHFTAGDTALSRKVARRGEVMGRLEHYFRQQPRTAFNPFVWLIRLYHWLFHVAWAAHSRQQEFAADRYQVQHAGKDVAASALLNLEIADRLPWARLDNIARSHAASNEPIEQIFAEHWRRAQSIDQGEWDEACRKALKKKTGLFDTHPALRERLKAMGVSAKRALKLIRHRQGSSARDLFPEWPTIEKLLTSELIAVYREQYQAKRELAQIMLGRPLS